MINQEAEGGEGEEPLRSKDAALGTHSIVCPGRRVGCGLLCVPGGHSRLASFLTFSL